MAKPPSRRWVNHTKHTAIRAWRAATSPMLTVKGMSLANNMGMSQADHVFLLGVPRAGTSLVSNILAAHPEISAFREESDFFAQRNYQYFRMVDVDDQTVLETVRSSSSRTELFDRLARHVLDRKPGASRVLEKTPGHAFHLTDLLAAYPNAQFVYLVREPRDSYASLYNGVKLPRFTVKEYADFWNRLATIALEVTDPRVHRIRYEDLVRTPDAVVQALTAWLGLDEGPDILSPEARAKHAPAYASRGDHNLLLKPITPKSIGRWRNVLSETDAETLYRRCRENAKRLDLA